MIKKVLTPRKRSLNVIYFILLFCCTFTSINSWAQGFNIYNPAEISQPWVSEINPSVISSQYSRVSIGLKVFHFGFLPNQNFEMRESHINASFPFYLPYEIGIGGDLRYFSAGIYSELSSSVMLSRKIKNNLSLGIKIGLDRFGFSKQDFNLVNANDPLLAGNLAKISFNFGFGAFWNPDHWSIGIGVDHVNRPDIGRQTSANLPQELCAAVGYKVGGIIPTLLLQHDGTYARYGLAVTVMHDRFGLFRFSFENTMPIKMEVQFNLSRDNSMQYGFDLPTEELSTVSMGSHEIVYNRILGRGPDIGQPKILISTDKMRIQEETIVRSMPPGLNQWQLENIDELVPGYLKANGNYRNLLIVPTGILNQYETETIRKQRYAKLSEEIKQKLQKNPELNLILQTDDQSLSDARALKQYLRRNGISSLKDIGIAKVSSSDKVKLDGFESGQQSKTREKPSCSVDKLAITFDLPGKVRKAKEWNLSIKNDKNEVVRTYKGKDKLPDQMEWDWKNEWGELVLPGQYSCSLTVKAMSGLEKSSKSLPINITRLNRSVDLRFTQESQLQASKIVP